MRRITVRVPASTANLGPGFDALGLALGMHLIVTCIHHDASSRLPALTLSHSGHRPESLDPADHLITRTLLLVLRAYDKELPRPLELVVGNPIPLARGLGSSGAAVVAGVLLANAIGELNLPRERLLNLCLQIEGHADNVAASLLGGLQCCYTATDDAGVIRVRTVSITPTPRLRVIALVPNYTLSTNEARKALPGVYKREDVVWNIQRTAVLVAALTQPDPDPRAVWGCTTGDRVHQPYRQHLVPGLEELRKRLRPPQHPGLLGVFLSGAGPTIGLFYAMPDHGDEEEAKIKIKKLIDTAIEIMQDEAGVDSVEAMILEVDRHGAQCEVVDSSTENIKEVSEDVISERDSRELKALRGELQAVAAEDKIKSEGSMALLQVDEEMVGVDENRESDIDEKERKVVDERENATSPRQPSPAVLDITTETSVTESTREEIQQTENEEDEKEDKKTEPLEEEEENGEQVGLEEEDGVDLSVSLTKTIPNATEPIDLDEKNKQEKQEKQEEEKQEKQEEEEEEEEEEEKELDEREWIDETNNDVIHPETALPDASAVLQVADELSLHAEPDDGDTTVLREKREEDNLIDQLSELASTITLSPNE